MDFEEFKTWREDVLATRRIEPENRFDCLNPFKAMDFSKRWGDERRPPGGQDAAAAAYGAWTALHLPSNNRSLHVEPTSGVRAALGAMFERLAKSGTELWLPEDVYPFYGHEARCRAPELAVRYFRTFPELDLSPLADASANAIILITDPMTPTGRFLTDAERGAIAAWTEAATGRWAVFDSVYLYSNSIPARFVRGMETQRFVHLFSMSKSWLLRGVFGAAVGGGTSNEWWFGLGVGPTAEACADALDALENHPAMPLEQSGVFEREWQRRAVKLAKYNVVCDGAGGYFRKVEVNHMKALEEDGIMLVPASVFGSTSGDWSVATCLYEAAKQKAWLGPR